MHYAIVIRDKHHKNYSGVSRRFIAQFGQVLANVHKAPVKVIQYHDKTSTGWTETYYAEFQTKRICLESELSYHKESILK